MVPDSGHGSTRAGDHPTAGIKEAIDQAIAENDLVLFMKGTPRRPRCGFSQRAVGVLGRYDVDLTTVDVLGDELPDYRAALADHSGWETIPQAYVDGEFVGGSDILVELHEQGSLADRLPD